MLVVTGRIRHGKPERVAPQNRPQYVPGLLVVRVRPDVVEGDPALRRAARAPARGGLAESVAAPFAELRRRGTLQDVVPVFATVAGRVAASFVAPASDGIDAAVHASIQHLDDDLRGINLVRVSKNADLARLERTLSETRGIEYAHRVPARWPAAAAARPDPMLNRQWGLRAIHWFSANRPNARGVKVAVLDTGVDTSHPDLPNIAYDAGIASEEDIVGHGTHVTGIIGAVANNHRGIAGVSTAKLAVWKIFGDVPDTDGEYYADELMYQRALNAVRASGAKVVNLSIGGTARSRTEEMLFGRLISAGITVVAAMGNEFEDGNPTEYPAAYKAVIAVGATTESDQRASFSNTGRHITLAAPGSNILSTLPMKAAPGRTETRYAAWSGTSMATPHVTAAAALVIAAGKATGPTAVAKYLASTAKGIDGKKAEVGAGLLNLASALS